MSDDLTPDLSGVQCTACGVIGQLRIESRLEAKPLGTWSLSGVQEKRVLESWPWMVCDACLAECKGKRG